MAGVDEMAEIAESANCETFPLGAGGGGAVLIFAIQPSSLDIARRGFKEKYAEIPFKIKDKGHELVNPLKNQ
jgi:hypothetical protein